MDVCYHGPPRLRIFILTLVNFAPLPALLLYSVVHSQKLKSNIRFPAASLAYSISHDYYILRIILLK